MGALVQPPFDRLLELGVGVLGRRCSMRVQPAETELPQQVICTGSLCPGACSSTSSRSSTRGACMFQHNFTLRPSKLPRQRGGLHASQALTVVGDHLGGDRQRPHASTLSFGPGPCSIKHPWLRRPVLVAPDCRLLKSILPSLSLKSMMMQEALDRRAAGLPSARRPSKAWIPPLACNIGSISARRHPCALSSGVLGPAATEHCSSSGRTLDQATASFSARQQRSWHQCRSRVSSRTPTRLHALNLHAPC
jgi:hypothetical protein